MSLGFRTSNIVPERLAEKMWFYKSQSLLLNIFTSVSVGSSPLSFLFPSATVRIPVYTAPRCSAELSPPPPPRKQNLSDVLRSTSEIGTAKLCSVTEIAPKSPFLCVAEALSGLIFVPTKQLDGIV